METPDFEISITEIHRISWSKEIPETILNFERPGEGGFFDLEGPKSFPKRPLLELFSSGRQLTGRMILGDDQVLPVAVIVDKVPTIIPLPHPPKSLLADENGNIWVLSQAGLAKYTAPDYQELRLGHPGAELYQGPEGAIWVIHSQIQTATLIDLSGEIISSHPWPYVGGSVSSKDGTLASLTLKEPLGIRKLTQNGGASLAELPGMDFFERLLWFDHDSVITLSGATVKKYRDGAHGELLVVQYAGLDEGGNPFISGRSEDQVKVWTNGQSTAMEFDLPEEVDWIRPYCFMGKKENRYLLKGEAKILEYDLELNFLESKAIDEKTFQQEIFPNLWEIGSITADQNGNILISASHKLGISIFKLEIK